MPDYFSHLCAADKIYEKLDKAHKNLIIDHDLYRLGAQGGDVFFAYELSVKKTNLGRRMHALPAEELFELLKDGNESYLAGFATHYALDCTLHPAIYAFESTSKSPLAHVNFEKDLGLYISRKFATPRRIIPRERVLAATFPIYDSVKNIEPLITVTGVERCLKRHFTYTRTIYKTKRQDYKLNYDYSSLAGAVDDAISFGVECVGSVLDGKSKGKLNGELFSRSFLEK